MYVNSSPAAHIFVNDKPLEFVEDLAVTRLCDKTAQLANNNTFSILDELDSPPLTGRRIPSLSTELDGFLSPPPLPTALSESSVSPVDRRSQRLTPSSRPGYVHFTPHAVTSSPVQASRTERACSQRPEIPPPVQISKPPPPAAVAAAVSAPGPPGPSAAAGVTLPPTGSVAGGTAVRGTCVRRCPSLVPASAGWRPSSPALAQPLGQPRRVVVSGHPGPPTALVVGTSMVRHVVVPKAQTFCYSGACVQDISAAALQLFRQHTGGSASTVVVVHAGINDLRFQQSEKLKADFVSLIDGVLGAGKRCVISGPLPPPCFGDVKFSRIRQFHIWMKGYCLGRGIPFVDNFTSFLNRPELFNHDGLHPNRTGSHLLSTNIELTLHTCKSYTT
ncbi:hypothetical protein SKAU_G00386120 [Synaphobranchus kaupii]|uniref:SGNH hydrolase-type esterase domain-containing protein n=1 Tax=Synaphobranchus kaupii TaxID=118154 RepID=A0A9Q1EEN8_SYNKA|nr:hypothetical protein SKAU_G00386120 [Synaphobranchus kaupii]